MTYPQELHFEKLLSTWNEHQRLRSSGAPIAELWKSRLALDSLRSNRPA